MTDVDWNAAAQVHERDDSGSDMFYDFKILKSGPLAELITYVLALPMEQRKRVVVDAAGVGSLNVQDVTALAARADFPAN